MSWTGSGNASWDTASANNWNLSTNGGSTSFMPGDVVVFDDTPYNLSGSTAQVVTINAANVLPYSVTFNNSLTSYALTGSYGISGSASLSVTGGGTVTIANSNAYTGGTTLSAGVLNLRPKRQPAPSAARSSTACRACWRCR